MPTEIPSSIQYGAERARRRSVAASTASAATATATSPARADGRPTATLIWVSFPRGVTPSYRANRIPTQPSRGDLAPFGADDPAAAPRDARDRHARVRDPPARRRAGGRLRQPGPSRRPSGPDGRAGRRGVLRECDERVLGADLPRLPFDGSRALAPGRRLGAPPRTGPQATSGPPSWCAGRGACWPSTRPAAAAGRRASARRAARRSPRRGTASRRGGWPSRRPACAPTSAPARGPRSCLRPSAGRRAGRRRPGARHEIRRAKDGEDRRPGRARRTRVVRPAGPHDRRVRMVSGKDGVVEGGRPRAAEREDREPEHRRYERPAAPQRGHRRRGVPDRRAMAVLGFG